MRISEEKKERIFEQILSYLYSVSPKPVFTSNIAKEMARDEEFIKKLLLLLKEKGLVNEIKKNPQGIDYVRRARWRLSKAAYHYYQDSQKTF